AGIFFNGTQGLLAIQGTHELARRAHLALVHPEDGGLIDASLPDAQKLPVPGIYPMAQGTESAGCRVVPGDGAHPCDPFFKVKPQFGALLGNLGSELQGQYFAAPVYGYLNLSVGTKKRLAHILYTGYGLAVHLHQTVADF